ncbi:SDR family NAD(P)-dependent oxidoreductase [Dawidia soli]|uniref:SDR family NAD(P)-dependent oxidoreductase n=1 Tax=Dawidia soli TaxID=2782352 RepID=UPI0020B2B110|nr:SDR family NAD(P)-dependent oxidoreductase [Dawidia soli]
MSHFGRIDVLVNNAGFGLLSAVEEASDEEVRKNYDANVFGLLKVTRAMLPYMRRQQAGHIINISSVGGLKGYVGWGLYGSTKFAVEGITEALAQEVWFPWAFMQRWWHPAFSARTFSKAIH